MIGLEAVAAVTTSAAASAAPANALPAPPVERPAFAFGDLLTRGMAQLEQKVDAADAMVRAFALDDSVPIHQVTIALAEARMAVDLTMQVRTQLVDAYREIMNTQL